MRSLRAGLVLAATQAVLLAPVEAAGAAEPTSGKITRGSSFDRVIVELTNNGSGPILQVDIDFPAAVTVLEAKLVSGATGVCAPNQSQPNSGAKYRAACAFDPDTFWPAGTTIQVEVRTDGPLADNTGANAFTCGIPCNPSEKDGPYAIPGPAPTGPFADLGVELAYGARYGAVAESHGLAWYDLTANKKGAWSVDFRAFLANHGPQDAMAPIFKVSADAPPATRLPLDYWYSKTGSNGNCGTEAGPPGLRPIRCTFDAMTPGTGTQDTELRFSLTFYATGPFTVTAEASSQTPDPGAFPNAATISDALEKVPESSRSRALRSEIGGFAKYAREVFAAVGREEGGAKLGEPDRIPKTTPLRAQAGASAACRWLTSKRVRFRRERGRRCDQPSYLRARVRNGRWKIKFRKPLPAGKYVLITRAVRADGVLESAVGPKLGNLKRFRVR